MASNDKVDRLILKCQLAIMSALCSQPGLPRKIGAQLRERIDEVEEVIEPTWHPDM
jgi:hypothetical protein